MKLFRKLIKFAFLAAIVALIVSRLRNRATDQDQDEDEGDFAWPPINLADSEDSADTPLAEPTDGSPLEPRHWVTCEDDGTCPASHPIKAKDSSGLYHVPGGNAYERTIPDRCYRSAEDAEADGYSPAQR